MKRYLRTLTVTIVVWIALAGLINFVVDPYGRWEFVRQPNFNDLKPAAAKRSRTIKSYSVLRAAPKTIIAGNSRPEMGLDPKDALWPDQLGTIYSLTLPGASFRLQLINAAHAIARGGVEHVILGVDFLDFLGQGDRYVNPRVLPARIPESERLLLSNFDVPNKWRFVEVIKDSWSSLISLDSLLDSAATVLGRHNHEGSTVTREGFNPASDFRSIIKIEGQAALFEHKNREVAQRLTKARLTIFQGGEKWSRAFEILSAFLKYAKQRNVDILLFINPYHADYLDAIYYAGYWDELEQWKVILASIAAQQQVPYWDFSNYDQYSTEIDPPAGLETLSWFWEPAHYRVELGRLMLKRLFALDGGDALGFGKKLLPQDLSTHLASIRLRQQTYWARAPERTARIQARVSKALGRGRGS